MLRLFIVLPLSLLCLSLCFVTPVHARDVGPYFTLSVGQSDVDVPNFDEGTSFALGVGFNVNRNFAIEGYYIDFGESDDGIPPVWTLSANAVAACLVGKVPFSNVFSGYAKVGFFSWEADLEEEGFGLIATDDGTDLTYGLGVLFDFSWNVSGFIQYQNYELNDIDIDNTSLGFQFNF